MGRRSPGRARRAMSLRAVVLLCLTALAHGAETSPSAAGAAPVISDLAVTPAFGPVGTRYRITLRISDPRGSEDIVPTLYQVRERVESIPLPINDRGEHGDVKANDGIYTAVSSVPPSAARGTHTFTVFVTDRAGRHSNVLLYRFTVVKGGMV